MPVTRIEVNEYECVRCGYKWINRINGKDGSFPKCCARCKRTSWDGIKSYEEVGLRRQIRGFKKLYEFASYYFRYKMPDELKYIEWSDELTEKFLNLKPRPTISELNRVVYPEGLPIKPLNSQNQFRFRGYVPNPEKPEWLKYDLKLYVKLRQGEAEQRQKIMEDILKERGIEL